MSASITVDNLTNVFVRIRDKRRELKRVFEAEDEVLKNKLKQVEIELLRRAQEEGVTGWKTPHGTSYMTEEQHTSIADPDGFMEFVLQTGDLLFYEQRPSLSHIREYQQAHDGELPPGVRMFRENRMRVRASKKEDNNES